MYYGRAQVGQYIFLCVRTESKTTARLDAAPDAAPTVTIYPADSSTAVVEDQKLPRIGVRGERMYGQDWFLGSAYSAGRYVCHFEWAEGGTAMARIGTFEVLPGGPSSKGAITSLYYYDRPHAKFLIAGCEDGTIEYSRNPSLT